MALFDVRPDERRATGLAFASLLGITAAHTMIETARDALFLAKIPVERLPLLYLAIAACGLLTTRIAVGLEARKKPKAPSKLDSVAISTLAAAGITAVFWTLAQSPTPALLYTLYVYTGLFASWVAGQLWVRIGAIFALDRAKRLFGIIGTGAVLGAVLGAAVARAALALVEVRHLLLVGAALLVVTALGPVTLLPRGEIVRARREALPKTLGLGAQVGEAVRDPYVVRLLGLALVATSVATAIDYVFKTEIALHVDRAHLGAVLATIALATNTASLVAQAVGVAVLLRIVGVQRALYVMPALVLVGATCLLAGGASATFAFAAALALRGIDGTLRYSLQKTTTELLFVPLPDSVRGRAKPIVDLLGQRGGQAVASVAILGIASIAGVRGVAIAVAALAATWLLLAFGIRPKYLEVFRATLRRGRLDLEGDLPALDMSALEALIAALSSKKDAEVLGALDLLAEQQRGRLLPSLILFHPSKPVVLRALELLVREKRTDFVPVADRLLTHPDAEVRAAALRARMAVELDPDFLRGLLDSEDDELRATALVALAGAGALDDEEARMKDLVTGPAGVRRALARAIGEIGVSGASRELLERTLAVLGKDEDVATRAEAATAMGRFGGDRFHADLLAMLADRSVRSAAVDALGQLGDDVLDTLDDALEDPRLPEDVRVRVVSAISRIGTENAIALLTRRLFASDTGIRTRVLRALRAAQGLGQKLVIDHDRLVELASSDVSSYARALAFRLAHAKLATKKTPASELLGQLLRDRELEAEDRLFLVLSLLHPRERFARIQRGLRSGNAKARASSRELLENIVRAPLRDVVLAMVDDTADDERLRAVGKDKERDEKTYEDLLAAMIEQGGELGALAAFHAEELGMREAAAKLEGPAGAFGEELSTRRLSERPAEATS
ncbi:MAG TPA: HEAT repeat domain-containing protein [Labilithrix sp.]